MDTKKAQLTNESGLRIKLSKENNSAILFLERLSFYKSNKLPIKNINDWGDHLQINMNATLDECIDIIDYINKNL